MNCSDKHNPFRAMAVLPGGHGGVVPCCSQKHRTESLRGLEGDILRS